MQVQSIGISTTEAFGHKHRDKMADATAFVNLDDSQLRDLAYSLSYDKESQKKAKNKMWAAFLAMPVIDTISRGILAKNETINAEKKIVKLGETTLSTKLRATGKTAVGWLGGLAIVGLYGGVKAAINNSSEGSRDFDHDHPILSFIVDMGLILGAFALGSVGLKKLNGKFPQIRSNIASKIETLSSKIDKSKLNNKTYVEMSKKVAEFGEKHQGLAKVGKSILENSLLVGLGVSILGSIGVSRKEQKRVEHNYKELKEAQLQTAQKLTKVLGTQRDVLAQNQIILAKELEYQINKQQAHQAEHHVEHHPEPEPEPKSSKPRREVVDK